MNNMDALRLALLYAIRYESTPGCKIGEMKRLLRERGVSKYTVDIVDTILRYGGTNKRGGDLFGDKG